MRNSLGRSAGVALLLVVLAALIYGLGRFLAGKGVSWAGDFGSVVSMFTGAFALITPIFSRLPRWLGGPPPISRLSLPQARDDLAAALSQQWKKEEQLRRVNDPWPLPVRWAVTSRAQAAMPGTPPDAGPSMADLSNHFDDIRDTFYRVRSRRLVILGEAGAGKSVLAMKLAGELLADRGDRMPVPVVVPASAWDPDQDLLDWVAEQLSLNHSGLAVPVKAATGEITTLASALVRDGVIPIIDGLDELPAARRGDAIARLNAVGSDFPLVVTSRPEEYLDAVDAAGRGISKGMVVELLPLRMSEAKAYLGEATAVTVTGRWSGVFDRMDGQPNGPLAQTLSTPLMLWLARTVYEDGDSDPGELLDHTRFSDRETIENHLLDAFVPAIYAVENSRQGGFDCTPQQAQRWLGYLASHLGRAGSPDVAWWRLNRTVRFAGPFCAVVRTLLLFNVWWWLATRILSRHAGHYHTFEEWRAGVRDIAFSGPLGRLCWPAFAPLWNPVRDSLEWLYPKLPAIAPWHSLSSWNIALAVLAFVWAALDFSIPADSTVLGPRKLRFRLSSALGGAMSGMLRAAFVWALLIYSLLTYVPSLSDSAGAVQFFGTAASWRAVFFLALFGLTSVSARFVTALDVSRSVSPPESLRMDRKADATEMLLDMAILATLFFLWSGREIALSYGIYALVAISVKLVTGGGTRASRSYVEARILLAGSRLMPWRMMGFLVDAHRRGALRQVGAVYEFRHVRLQERLAAPHGRWSRRLDALARHVVGERIAESVIRPLRRSVEMLQSALSAVAAYVTRMVHTRGEKSARAHGWQTTGRGFVRSYRDPRFDALSAGQIDSETGPRAGG